MIKPNLENDYFNSNLQNLAIASTYTTPNPPVVRIRDALFSDQDISLKVVETLFRGKNKPDRYKVSDENGEKVIYLARDTQFQLGLTYNKFSQHDLFIRIYPSASDTAYRFYPIVCCNLHAKTIVPKTNQDSHKYSAKSLFEIYNVDAKYEPIELPGEESQISALVPYNNEDTILDLVLKCNNTCQDAFKKGYPILHFAIEQCVEPNKQYIVLSETGIFFKVCSSPAREYSKSNLKRPATDDFQQERESVREYNKSSVKRTSIEEFNCEKEQIHEYHTPSMKRSIIEEFNRDKELVREYNKSTKNRSSIEEFNSEKESVREGTKSNLMRSAIDVKEPMGECIKTSLLRSAIDNTRDETNQPSTSNYIDLVNEKVTYKMPVIRVNGGSKLFPDGAKSIQKVPVISSPITIKPVISVNGCARMFPEVPKVNPKIPITSSPKITKVSLDRTTSKIKPEVTDTKQQRTMATNVNHIELNGEKYYPKMVSEKMIKLMGSIEEYSNKTNSEVAARLKHVEMMMSRNLIDIFAELYEDLENKYGRIVVNK